MHYVSRSQSTSIIHSLHRLRLPHALLPAGLKAIGSLALLQTAASSSSIAYSALGSRQCWNDGMVRLPSASWQPSDRDARIESAVSSM